MDKSIKDFYLTQEVEDYEKSHDKRFNHLIKDLSLDSISNSKIADIGCGYGPIFKRLSKIQHNKFIGFDGADIKTTFEYYKVDLSYDFFGDDYIKNNEKVDYALCFETLEHLTNPYHCIIEIKKILKDNGLLFLSIPDVSVTHNTIYPTLIYPVNNFIIFLNQMAFEILDLKVHKESFCQQVFILKNKDWSKSRMLWEKNNEPMPPHVLVNL